MEEAYYYTDYEVQNYYVPAHSCSFDVDVMYLNSAVQSNG